jgi:hypothetical protein
LKYSSNQGAEEDFIGKITDTLNFSIFLKLFY